MRATLRFLEAAKSDGLSTIIQNSVRSSTDFVGLPRTPIPLLSAHTMIKAKELWTTLQGILRKLTQYTLLHRDCMYVGNPLYITPCGGRNHFQLIQLNHMVINYCQRQRQI